MAATETRKPMSVTICMGSSCFSRGNNRNIEVIQSFLAARNVPVTVELQGHLCESRCKHGPNIIIDGKAYREVDPVTVIGLLNQHLAERDAGSRGDKGA